jgi:hypothetical protein
MPRTRPSPSHPSQQALIPLPLYAIQSCFSTVQQPPSGPGPPHYRCFTITLRHTTLGRTPLDELSTRRRDLYLTTQNTHKRQISMPPAGFKPAIPARELPQTHALDRAVTGLTPYKLLYQTYCQMHHRYIHTYIHTHTHTYNSTEFWCS